MQGSWLPTLRNLVSQINETFSRNFQEMAVAGEVSLGIIYYYLLEFTTCYLWFPVLIYCFLSDEHDTDFDQFGILVKVKFRWVSELVITSPI